MGEIVPGVAVIAVVLTDRPPLALAEVGAPFLPGDVRLARLVQPFLLSDIHQGPHCLPPPPPDQLNKSSLATSPHAGCEKAPKFGSRTPSRDRMTAAPA